ncbi:MAG: GAF domain-containing sensor histidine kinase [Deltaproteobacteria bacterium]|nr:GAF domain-containing sensor histidine kinase [Candidatus Anaeroferrophillacea bacterium]
MIGKLQDFLASVPDLQERGVTRECLAALSGVIEDNFLADFLARIVAEIDEVIAIDPRGSLQDILCRAAELIVNDLDATAATIRLLDPRSFRLISFGAHGLPEAERKPSIPVEDTIAGAVISEKRSITVPDILVDPRYHGKETAVNHGIRSLIAVPIRIPTFLAPGREDHGVLQIYFPESGRDFSRLLIMRAELLARRVSHVLALRKINDLRELNRRKEEIVNQIFIKLSYREGVKLKDLFILLIPELESFVHIQGCTLFAVSDDGRRITAEAAYPLESTYHELHHAFTVDNHPYFHQLINGGEAFGDFADERVDPGYLLIKKPLESRFVTADMRDYARRHNIYTILLVPLRIDDRVRHVLMFFAADQKSLFRDEEIELLTFFGKEIMKASRLEFLGNVLHDFKNPAIAITGFVNRLRRKLASPDLETVRPDLARGVEIILRESNRLQDLALAMTGDRRLERLDLGKIARSRYSLNEAVIEEAGLDHVTPTVVEFSDPLPVSCSRFGLERVFDNLLHNATKAVPVTGGELGMRGYARDGLVCIEVWNTGIISAARLDELRTGRASGRGLDIVSRFVHTYHGMMDISVNDRRTFFTICLPREADPVIATD